jgi:hypothetical protein
MMLKAAGSGKLRVGEGDHPASRGAQHRANPAIFGGQQRYRADCGVPLGHLRVGGNHFAHTAVQPAAERHPRTPAEVHREDDRP